MIFVVITNASVKWLTFWWGSCWRNGGPCTGRGSNSCTALAGTVNFYMMILLWCSTCYYILCPCYIYNLQPTEIRKLPDLKYIFSFLSLYLLIDDCRMWMYVCISRWANVHMGAKTQDYRPPPPPADFDALEGAELVSFERSVSPWDQSLCCALKHFDHIYVVWIFTLDVFYYLVTAWPSRAGWMRTKSGNMVARRYRRHGCLCAGCQAYTTNCADRETRLRCVHVLCACSLLCARTFSTIPPAKLLNLDI